VTAAKALVWGFSATAALTVIALLVGFVGQLNVELPGLSVTSDAGDGPPSTYMSLDPLVLLVLALAASAVIWAVTAGVRRIRARS
jgi:hypothetical protein